MISFREFVQAFREVGLNPGQPVIVHASLSAVGEIRGGAETVLGALLSMAKGVMAPTFTYKTMIIPEIGPENNAMNYGTGKDQNRMAEFYLPDMPADPLMGVLPEKIRTYPGARRSFHPLLSFSGIHVDEALNAQTEIMAALDAMGLRVQTAVEAGAPELIMAEMTASGEPKEEQISPEILETPLGQDPGLEKFEELFKKKKTGELRMQDPDSFWDTVSSERKEVSQPGVLTFEQAQKLGLFPSETKE